MKNLTRGLLSGIIATVPMTLYQKALGSKRDEDGDEEVLNAASSVMHGAAYGLAVWAGGLLTFSPKLLFRKKGVQFLPAYLAWGAALGFAENRLRAHQQRQINALD